MDEGLIDVENRIISLLREMTGTRASVGRYTQLARDLGMDGDDASEFLEAFSKQFAVDMSAFRFDAFFGPEAGPNPFVFLAALLGWRRKLHPITVADLAAAAAAHKWQLVVRF